MRRPQRVQGRRRLLGRIAEARVEPQRRMDLQPRPSEEDAHRFPPLAFASALTNPQTKALQASGACSASSFGGIAATLNRLLKNERRGTTRQPRWATVSDM